MDMTGEYRIAAPRDKVWRSLNDPAILQQCIPGCESLEKVTDTELNGKVRAKVGPVSARFGGKVTLSDLDPPNSYRISGEGAGGAAGFAKGGAAVSLRDESGATVLSYKVEANVGGKLAQIGSRLIDGAARKMADDFFSRFAAIVGAPSEPPQTPPVPAQASPAERARPEPAPAQEAPLPNPPPPAAPTGLRQASRHRPPWSRARFGPASRSSSSPSSISGCAERLSRAAQIRAYFDAKTSTGSAR